MVRGNNALAIQEHLEAAYFVLALSVPISNGQNTAPLRHGIDAKVLRSSAWLLGGTCLENLKIYAWRIKSEVLRRVILASILSRNKCGGHKTKASYPRGSSHAGNHT
jgi:hypothetical protein